MKKPNHSKTFESSEDGSFVCFYYENYISSHPEQAEQIIKQIWIDTIQFENLGSDSSGNITELVGAENRKYISSDMFMVVPTDVFGTAVQGCDRGNATATLNSTHMQYNVSYNSRTGDYTVNTVATPRIGCLGNWGTASSSWTINDCSVTYNVYLIVW